MKPFFKIFITCTLLFSIALSTNAQGLVGIYFSKDPSGETNYPMILGIVDGSPAEKVGLKIGQRIKSIDGKDADLSKTDQGTVLGWVKGPIGSALELLVTEPNDVTKTEAVTFNRGPAPTAVNRLTNVATVSRYFPMRLWACFDTMENRADILRSDLIETTQNYNDKELKRYQVTKVFMNEKQEGVFESYVDKNGVINRETYHDLLSFVLIENLESHFLAKKYYEETKEQLIKALETEGKFTSEEDISKKGNTATNFGGFSTKKETEKLPEWQDYTFWAYNAFESGKIGSTDRYGYYAKTVRLKLIGDGLTWKIVIEIGVTSTL